MRAPWTPAHAEGQGGGEGGLSNVLVNMRELIPLTGPRALINVVGACG